MTRIDRPHRPTQRRAALRLPRPRAGGVATGLFLAALALSAAAVPLSRSADAPPSHGTAQAALTEAAR